MKKLKLLSINTIALVFVSLFGFLFFAPSAYAATPVCTGGGLSIPKCGSTYDEAQYNCVEGEDPNECAKNNPLTVWLVFFINLISVLIIIGASTMLIVAGIQYISAADNPQKIQAAKEKIRNVLIGIVAFFFMFAFLQWLIPGGAF